MKSFTVNHRIHFDQCDCSGRIFFAELFTVAHRSIEDLIAQTMGWTHWFDHPEWIVPLRKAEAEYFGELRAGDKVQVDVKVAKIGNSSIQFLVTFMKAEKKLATTTTTHVFVDRKQLQPLPIPETIRQQLAQYYHSP